MEAEAAEIHGAENGVAAKHFLVVAVNVRSILESEFVLRRLGD